MQRIWQRGLLLLLIFMVLFSGMVVADNAPHNELRVELYAAPHAILTNEEVIFNFLTQEMELNIAAACGVLANIERESGFKSDLLEYGYTWANGGGYGICQWTNYPRTAAEGRRTLLVTWCGAQGLDYKTLEGQLQYLAYELGTAYYNRLVTTHLREVANTGDGARYAGWRWCYYFEVPAGYNTGVSDARGELAYQYWLRYAPLHLVLELGDINDDGKVDSSDARMILQAEVGLITFIQVQQEAGNVDGIGETDSSDARMILQYEVGLIKQFGVQ